LAGEDLLGGDGARGRPRPMNAISQLNRTAMRFLNPVKNTRWTTSHSCQPMKLEARMGPMVAMARNREIVAIVPRPR
jgi:hypothetical protein